jgi:hypothetical protein
VPSTRIAVVRTVRRAWGAVVRLRDPDYDKDKHRVLEYDFRPEGGTAFYADPYKRGALAPDSE